MNSGSLVLYKGQAAIVRQTLEKIHIDVADGRSVKVREKDVVLLHPGTVKSFSELDGSTDGELREAWEVLEGSSTDIKELAELAFGSYTPATAWSAWKFVEQNDFFDGTPDSIVANSSDLVNSRERERAERKDAEERYAAFLLRLKSGSVLDEDRGLLGDVEAVAFGVAAGSKTLRDLGVSEKPESAHRFLLRIGVWDETINPHPARVGFSVADAPDTPFEPEAAPDSEQRIDLTHLRSFAIDDNASTTPDDAIGVEGELLWVHIADPSAVVHPHGEMDLAARERGATLHLPERVVHMVSPRVIERYALGNEERSPALSWKIAVQSDGTPVLLDVVASWIRVERVTYRDAETTIPEEVFAKLVAITERSRLRREQRGAVSFDMPEVNVKVLDGGEIKIERIAGALSRDIVQEAMIMTGEATGRWAAQQGIPVPYTVQDADRIEYAPQTLSEMYAARRKMRRSSRSVTAGEHAGLGIFGYTQCTSPLRRYPDLMVHQQIRAHIGGSACPYSSDDISSVMNAVDERMGDSRYAEQQSNLHWKLAYLNRNPEWTGTGVVVGRRDRGAAIVIPELALETAVYPQAKVENDQTVEVVCTKADLPALSVHFDVME